MICPCTKSSIVPPVFRCRSLVSTMSRMTELQRRLDQFHHRKLMAGYAGLPLRTHIWSDFLFEKPKLGSFHIWVIKDKTKLGKFHIFNVCIKGLFRVTSHQLTMFHRQYNCTHGKETGSLPTKPPRSSQNVGLIIPPKCPETFRCSFFWGVICPSTTVDLARFVTGLGLFGFLPLDTNTLMEFWKLLPFPGEQM